jgi:hypothetical protein
MVEIETGKPIERCPVFWKTKRYEYKCNAKIIRKEPLISSEMSVAHVVGPVVITGCRTGEESVPYYFYECENGHLLCRPDWWADVPIVPPGTIEAKQLHLEEHPEWYLKERRGKTMVNIQPRWYQEMTDKGRDMIWKKEGE